MLDWMNHKQDSRLMGEISTNLRYADNTALMAGSEELKSLLMKVKEESEKAGLKQQSKNLRSDIWSHHFMENRREKSCSSDIFYFGGLQNHCGR